MTSASLKKKKVTKAAGASKAVKMPAAPFAQKLVLNQWLFGLFGIHTKNGFVSHDGAMISALEKFKHKFNLNESSPEGVDENNISKFYHQIINISDSGSKLSKEQLLEYDQNIIKHTQSINSRRLARSEQPIVWKYFQYLSLLFTEVYLDRYFSSPENLLAEVNTHIAEYNKEAKTSDQVAFFDVTKGARKQLNKISLWSATGSGKTLIMQMNILQYQHYLKKHQQEKSLNRMLLLTPNEGLSEQHLKEFKKAGIEAELFNETNTSLFSNQLVEIVDVHKLKDEKGIKTFAIESFEGNNLVLVDEGHRGAGSESGMWMKARNALCEEGFSFEYSATFSQAVKNSPALGQLYNKNILFDYSYRYFYGDGYGKDYNILNLDESIERQHRETYLCACLLAFYQQLRLYRDKREDFLRFNIEKPLWTFVGSKVTAGLGKEEGSDITNILLFLAHFIGKQTDSIENIRRVMEHGLLTAEQFNIFEGRFGYLTELALTPEQIYPDVLNLLFNSPSGGALHVKNIKGVAGEISLHIGDNKPFGVINVGDDSGLIDLCDKHPEWLITGENEFSQSLFEAINSKDNEINLLIGSKKFSEGWNSWRVSTMGLMNVGATEGAQIIQLFGRGVRLRGLNESLKRSIKSDVSFRPKHIELLETLNIFGIRANYMQQFKEYLKDEGLPANQKKSEYYLPIVKNLGTKKLKTIRLKKEINGINSEFDQAFKRLGPIPSFAPPAEGDGYLQKNKVIVNWYPKVQALFAEGLSQASTEMELNEAILTEQHIALLDLDELYFDLQSYKAERGWYNLNISKQGVQKVLEDHSWYLIHIPKDYMAFDKFRNVLVWQQLASSLLKKYCERFYLYKKKKWEEPHLEYRELNSSDQNFPSANDDYPDGYYRLVIDQSKQEIVDKIAELKKHIKAGKLADFKFPGFEALVFQQHLYHPLLHLNGLSIEISPVALNTGEQKFVTDLRSYYESNSSFFAGKELYLLRNLSRGRGVGFFEAGNFFPDFILWLLDGNKQYVTFLDPKGMRHLGKDDPKISFYQTIKEIEKRLGDTNVVLNSILVSNTSSSEMKVLWQIEKPEMLARNIVFQNEDALTYIEQIFKKIKS